MGVDWYHSSCIHGLFTLAVLATALGGAYGFVYAPPNALRKSRPISHHHHHRRFHFGTPHLRTQPCQAAASTRLLSAMYLLQSYSGDGHDSSPIEFEDEDAKREGFGFDSLARLGLNVSSALSSRNIVPAHLVTGTDLFCNVDLNMAQVCPLVFILIHGPSTVPRCPSEVPLKSLAVPLKSLTVPLKSL